MADDRRLAMVPVGAQDRDRCYAILLECSVWLRDRGNDQWTPPYPRHRFAADVDRGLVFAFLDDRGTLGGIATVSLDRPAYYPAELWRDRVRAWYLARLAVPRALAGQGIGRRILATIEWEAGGAGVERLRLDCLATNEALAHYYRRAGFVAIGEAAIGGRPAIFFERAIVVRQLTV